MTYRKTAPAVLGLAVICGAAILWLGYREKAQQRKLAEAARLCRAGAGHGDAHAQSGLGNMYRSGRGVPQDFAEALRWYRKAASQGDADAQYSLANMYRKGQGMPRDYAEALRWYREAADKGDANAQYALGFMYCKGDGVPQDYGAGVFWFRKSADQGNVDAQYSLGNVYRDGDGVPRDNAEAVRWYRKAADQGYTQGRQALFSMYCRGRGAPLIRWTSIAVFLMALLVLFVPQRRWGRATWLLLLLCSAICAALLVDELLLSAFSTTVLALGSLGPLWRGVGRALLIAILGGGAAIYAFGAVWAAVRMRKHGVGTDQPPTIPEATTGSPA